jgi:glycosyltransferase involved in cell wall biosynthesis
LKNFIIFCPFRQNFEVPTGSNIRIRGYVEPLTQLGIEYQFFAPAKPDYIPQDNFTLFNLSPRSKKLFLLHNLCFVNFIFKPISYLIYKLFLNKQDIKNNIPAFKQSIIISHQENAVILFLHFRLKIKSIYDIHGILNIQKEYLENLNLWKAFWFRIQLINEKLVFKYIHGINVVSKEMKEYVLRQYNYKGTVYLAPDGLLKIPIWDDKRIIQIKAEHNVSENDRIIMFFGSFKKFGGVHMLAEAFSEIALAFPNTKLFLIGEGQMQKHVLKIIKQSNLISRYIHIPSVPYEDLHNYLQLAEIIVLPDIRNTYNEITPHIKTYDSIATGAKIVLPDFNVNKDIIKTIGCHVDYFAPSNLIGLKNSIIEGLSYNKNSGIHNVNLNKKIVTNQSPQI